MHIRIVQSPKIKDGCMPQLQETPKHIPLQGVLQKYIQYC